MLAGRDNSIAAGGSSHAPRAAHRDGTTPRRPHRLHAALWRSDDAALADGPGPRRAAAPSSTRWWGIVPVLPGNWAPHTVRPLLQAGPVPDGCDGARWVGSVPFYWPRLGFLGPPPLPYLSGFAEPNVRLYAVDGRGRR